MFPIKSLKGSISPMIEYFNEWKTGFTANSSRYSVRFDLMRFWRWNYRLSRDLRPMTLFANFINGRETVATINWFSQWFPTTMPCFTRYKSSISVKDALIALERAKDIDSYPNNIPPRLFGNRNDVLRNASRQESAIAANLRDTRALVKYSRGKKCPL